MIEIPRYSEATVHPFQRRELKPEMKLTGCHLMSIHPVATANPVLVFQGFRNCIPTKFNPSSFEFFGKFLQSFQIDVFFRLKF